MERLDAKTIRERLNTVMIALATLEDCSLHANHKSIAATARAALQDIAVLVTEDELAERRAGIQEAV